MAVCALTSSSIGYAQNVSEIKVGIIGCDTSHVIAFTKILNSKQPLQEADGIRVVVAFPGGSPDLPDSQDRVAGYVAQLKNEFHVEIVDSIPALLGKCDAVLLESVDGRPHWEQVQPILAAGKPVFVDKPFAGSLVDAIRIAQLAEKTKTPVFSSSALRFTPGIAKARNDEKTGNVIGCLAYSPCAVNQYHPDLYWYGIHGAETLFTIMGKGCVSVQRTYTEGTDIVTGVWNDGRVGTFRGIRHGHKEFGALVFGTKGVHTTGGFTGYDPLVVEIARFFKTGKSPVPLSETIEILAFMNAADISKKNNGAVVLLSDVLERAKQQAAGK
ncbi:MAG: Gfo/Idh/MocA family oxidoreductase [Planctomycetia bacterium]|nr:Gfo/Idh/MocA family oxidoreductase [Planctomycetia bacterium]